MTGITGTADVDAAALPQLLNQIQERANGVPVCVGFGIKTPEQVRSVCALESADGAVVGTALVTFLHENRAAPDLLEKTKACVAALKATTSPP
jgi:tryptophan synthase alpha chain